MKKLIVSFAVVLVIFSIFSVRASASELDIFDESLNGLRDSLSDETLDKLKELGFSGSIDDFGNLDLNGLFTQFINTVADALGGPLSAAVVVIAAVILSAMLETYTHSLRYTDTREICSMISALFILAQLLRPLSGLIHDSLSVLKAASDLMLVFVPVMAGILSFSGRAVSSAGYCATVLSVSQIVSVVSSRFLAPGLSAMLGVSASAGLGGRLRLKGICDMLYSFLKWSLLFLMTIYTAVLSLQTTLSNAADTVASKVARFTLSSVIPLIGSSISEAYRAIRSGVDLLRSGAGVFVILALIVTFLSLIVRSALWLGAINICRCAADTFEVQSCSSALSSVSAAVSALMAVIICVCVTFIISAALMMSMGGAV